MGDGLFFPNGMQLSLFYNENTLNIFSDASIMRKRKKMLGCYGAIAVVGDTILEERYRLAAKSTSSNSEIKGIRTSICLALKYANQFEHINLLSDSQMSIYALRDYIYKWRFKRGLLYTSSGSKVVNQEIFIECHQLLQDPRIKDKINFFHQSGHIDNSYDKLLHAREVFATSNNIVGKIDLNIIRYISTYNQYIDYNTRIRFKSVDKSLDYHDPVYFRTDSQIKRQ